MLLKLHIKTTCIYGPHFAASLCTSFTAYLFYEYSWFIVMYDFRSTAVISWLEQCTANATANCTTEDQARWNDLVATFSASVTQGRQYIHNTVRRFRILGNFNKVKFTNFLSLHVYVQYMNSLCNFVTGFKHYTCINIHEKDKPWGFPLLLN